LGQIISFIADVDITLVFFPSFFKILHCNGCSYRSTIRRKCMHYQHILWVNFCYFAFLVSWLNVI